MTDPEAGRGAERAAPGEVDRIITIPTLFTLVRLLCLPLFLYLLLGRDNRAGAGWLLGALGATDWVDGFLARRLGQVSEFGKKFDPTVDRVLFIVAIVGIIIDGAGPTWFYVVVLARELFVGITVAIATIVFRMVRFDVTFLGKVATAALMAAVPGFLIGDSDFPGATGLTIASWVIGLPGLALSLLTAILYVPRIRAGVVSARAAPSRL